MPPIKEREYSPPPILACRYVINQEYMKRFFNIDNDTEYDAVALVREVKTLPKSSLFPTRTLGLPAMFSVSSFVWLSCGGGKTVRNTCV